MTEQKPAARVAVHLTKDDLRVLQGLAHDGLSRPEYAQMTPFDRKALEDVEMYLKVAFEVFDRIKEEPQA